jgi:DNA modification methylase
VTPYYSDDFATIYHGDCREVDAWLDADVLVTDPPYGIDYRSGHFGTLPRSIAGDGDTDTRDQALVLWGQRPALVFGTWRRPRPAATRQVLVWDTGGALGMGALDLPWKPSHQEVYVLGSGFDGKRSSDVLRVPPVQAMAQNGRVHPHEKPVALMSLLLAKCPPGVIADPFMGSGPTLLAAKAHGRKAIACELDERYCEIAAKRLAQEVLDFGGVA